MKTKLIAAMLMSSLLFSSCATILGGPVSQCQRTRPSAGQPTRRVRAIALVADIILFWPGAVIDFATSAIYVPCDNQPSGQPAKGRSKWD